MYRKIGMYFLSLSLLFIFILILTLQIPVYFGQNWIFVGWQKLLSTNVIPILCIISLIFCVFAYYDLKYVSHGTPNLKYQIISIKNVETENLSFLATYILPLVCFDFKNIRQCLVYGLLLVVMGRIFVKTNLFYANPILSVIGFNVFRVDLKRNNDVKKDIILITRYKLCKGTFVSYIKFDENVFYVQKIG